MAQFLQALKTIVLRKEHINVVINDNETPSSLMTSRTIKHLQHLLNGDSDATTLLRELAASIQTIIPEQLKLSLSNFVEDKSQSELLFLTSIVMAVVLFVLILPAYEALFGEDQATKSTSSFSSSKGFKSLKDEDDESSESGGGEPLQSLVRRLSRARSGSGESTASTRSSSSSSSSSRSSACSMDTIEESEEEDFVDDDSDDDQEEEDDDELAEACHQGGDDQIMMMEDEEETVVTSNETTPNASEQEEEEDTFSEQEQQQPETVKDKACYYEFLTFINTPSGRCLVEADAREVANPFADLPALRNSKESNNTNTPPVSPGQDEEQETPVPSNPPAC